MIDTPAAYSLVSLNLGLENPMALLRFFRDGNEMMRFPLGSTEVWIGRNAECDVVLPDSAISRKHACLQNTPQGWRLEDNSINGTLHNG